MIRKTNVLALAPLLLLSLAACGSEEREAQAKQAARQAEWTWLQTSQGELAKLKQEVRAAQAALDGAAEDAKAAAQASLEAAEKQAIALEEEFGRRLVEYINADPIIQGEAPTQSQLDALRMKSDADIAMAQEYVELGGDYRRAIDILETARSVDPDNPKLLAELEKHKTLRYATQERFDQVKRGMTQDEVRAVLGPVNLRNIRDYPERKVVAWFYPKEAGGAAAVFFETKDDRLVVYKVDFEAVKPGAQVG
jgi:outer membrane protein assembly factor BamE (lipoprotein component of BamABCDE complex)